MSISRRRTQQASQGSLTPGLRITDLTPSGPIVATTGQVIRGLKIMNPSGSGIIVPGGVTNVTIEDCEIGPCGSTVNDMGILLDVGSSAITIRHCVIHDVATGIYVLQSQHPIIIEYNIVYDVRGPMPRGQMVQFNTVSGGNGQSRIVGNISDKQLATITTHYEDHISMYASSGTAESPILIARNKIRGGDSASGSAMMIGDGGGGWYHVRENTVVLTPNTGIGIPGGHDISVVSNTVYNSGADAASGTQNGYYVANYSSSAPTNIHYENNRGIARAWVSGSGETVGSFYSDGSAINMTDINNSWQDNSLTADF